MRHLTKIKISQIALNFFFVGLEIPSLILFFTSSFPFRGLLPALLST